MKIQKIIFILIISLFIQNYLESSATILGQSAPDFALENLSNQKVSLKELQSKVVLLNFFASWCPYCIKEIPKIIQLNKRYKNSALMILGIAIQEPKNKLLKFINKKQINYSILLDLEAKVANKYNIRGIPTNVLIDKNGIVRYYANLLPDEDLIKSLLPIDKKIQLELDKKVPNFSLLDINNKKFTLNHYFGSYAIMLWFTNLCSSCQAGISALEAVHKKYKNSVEILAISQLGNNIKTVQEVINKLKPSFTFLIDLEGEVCKLYTGEYIPNTCPLNNIYFIDKNGILKFISHYPGLSKKELEKEIKVLISGENQR